MWVMNMNISWYLYTHEQSQKTRAAARVTRGARGANTSPTAPMNNYGRGFSGTHPSSTRNVLTKLELFEGKISNVFKNE